MSAEPKRRLRRMKRGGSGTSKGPGDTAVSPGPIAKATFLQERPSLAKLSRYFFASFSRSSTRRTLPEMVLGSASTNSMTRGYL